jgi:hypothetical protein
MYHVMCAPSGRQTCVHRLVDDREYLAAFNNDVRLRAEGRAILVNHA